MDGGCVSQIDEMNKLGRVKRVNFGKGTMVMFKNFNGAFCAAITTFVATFALASAAGAEELSNFASPPAQELSLTPKPVLLDDAAPEAAPEKSWDDSANGWYFLSHPGLWMSGIKGSVGVGARVANVNASFSDLLDKLDIGLAPNFEIGNGPLAFVFDGMWDKFEANGTGPGGNIKGDITSNFAYADGALAYQFLNKSFGDGGESAPRLTMGALGGARWTYLSMDVKLKGGPLNGSSRSQSVNWVDPYVGLRGTFNLNKQLDVAVAGTIGGFNVGSKLAWSVNTMLEYRFTRKIAAYVGYKVLSYNYDLNGFTWDVKLQGPMVGLTLRW
jgi:hypothetical protein